MKTSRLGKTLSVAALFILFVALATVAFQARGSDAKEPPDASGGGRGLTPEPAEWREIFADDKGYLDEYKKIAAEEQTFSGVLKYEKEKGPSTLMRWLPYKLDGVGVYTGSKDLKEFLDKKVEIVGKKHSFDLEGQVVTEIWPIKIRLAAAQEPPKAFEHKEIPAKPVNGLLFEIKLLNTRPLLPGDTTLELEYRFTDAREKEEIQLLDNSGLFNSAYFSISMIDPDGKPLHFAERKVELTEPKGPTCTLWPGHFYGGRIMVREGLKPGNYSLSFNYLNDFDLKDKGFNLWTGKAQSNTIVFEVAGADVKPVNGIQMFIRMKKEKYSEDEPVTVEVRLFNAGDKEQGVYVPDKLLLVYYSKGEIKDESGKTVPWQNIVFVRAPGVKYEKLAPGAAFVKEYDLRSVCKLPPGKYTFRLTSNIPWANQDKAPPALVSNEVRFEIAKAEPEK